jgi:hypothetical protein
MLKAAPLLSRLLGSLDRTLRPPSTEALSAFAIVSPCAQQEAKEH